MEVRDNSKDMEVEYDNSGQVENSAKLLDDYISDAVDYRNQVADFAIFNQTYGPKERNKLDIFWPGKDRDGPITMFIHGGYWQRLDRSAFSHMAKGLNAKGIAVAIPSYTLCPNITISGIIDELRRACVILWKTYDRPLTVFGHSAGGHLAACMLATKWNRIHNSLPEQMVQSALSISGVFELAPLIETSHNNALRLNEEEAKKASPYNWLIEPGQRFDAWVGAHESEEFRRQSRSQAQRWRMMGATTRYVEIPGSNHFTAIHPLTNPNSAMIARLVQLMEPAKAPTIADLNIADPKPAVQTKPEKTEADPASQAGTVEEKPPARKKKAAKPRDDDADDRQNPEGRGKKSPDPETTVNLSSDEAKPATDASQEQEKAVSSGQEDKSTGDGPDFSQEVADKGSEEQENIDISHNEPVAELEQDSTEDDLTKINDIGDVLAARLKDLGFSSFDQLADLSKSDQKMIEEILDFKGRIKQEHWITQARHQKAIKELAAPG